MKIIPKHNVFFVDDDAKICKLISEELESINCNVKSFTNAIDCLEQIDKQKKCSLLITDVKMPDMDGLTLLQKTKKIAPWIPVMVITGFGDIPMSVRAIKLGAIDFIEKPLDRRLFLNKVKSILSKNDFADIPLGKALTKTEKKVLKLILDGKANKEIASTLDRALRTVELHRSNIMHKFQTDSIVELVKKTINMDLSD